MARPNDPRPDFSDVKSGSSSEAMSREAAQRPETETYTVVAGDTLSRIAKRYYGDAARWREIYDANRDLIQNPDLIHVGWELKIPQPQP